MSTLRASLLREEALLPEDEVSRLMFNWSVWAMPHQLPPDGDWTTWLLLGGRGAGKTRAGAEWVRMLAEKGIGPIALVGETMTEAEMVMVKGESGILRISPPWMEPRLTGSVLIWPNGVEAHLLPASDPERFRGPQFAAAWCDETAKDGVFRAELRSPQQALNITRGRVFQGLCDASVGDARCGVDIDNAAYRGEAIVVGLIDDFQLRVSGLAGFEENWFALGVAQWTDGQRHGLRDPILTHRRDADGDILGFSSRVGEWSTLGDALIVTVGCDRRFTTCREKFANTVNFRGFPHIPGSDYVLRHPRSGYAMDGRPVVP